MSSVPPPTCGLDEQKKNRHHSQYLLPKRHLSSVQGWVRLIDFIHKRRLDIGFVCKVDTDIQIHEACDYSSRVRESSSFSSAGCDPLPLRKASGRKKSPETTTQPLRIARGREYVPNAVCRYPIKAGPTMPPNVPTVLIIANPAWLELRGKISDCKARIGVMNP